MESHNNLVKDKIESKSEEKIVWSIKESDNSIKYELHQPQRNELFTSITLKYPYKASLPLQPTDNWSIELYLNKDNSRFVEFKSAYQAKVNYSLNDSSYPQETFIQLKNGFTKYKFEEKVKNFLSLLEKYGSVDVKTQKHILETIGMRKPEQDMTEEVNILMEEGKFNEAISFSKLKQSEGHYEIIWEVANNLTHPQLPIDEQIKLIDLYESILPENPHYAEANERLVALYTTETCKKTEEAVLESKLIAAVHSKNLRLTNQIFHQLCGYKDLQPTVSFSQVMDAPALISLAKQLRSANQTIYQQAETIKKIGDENRSLKAKINSLENKKEEKQEIRTRRNSGGAMF